MRIGIVTLPLHTNYGGLLQAYALKAFLESQGHEATVLDIQDKMPTPSLLKAPFVYASRALKRVIKGSSGPEVFRERRYARELPVVSQNTSKFVQEYIQPRIIKSYSQINEGEYDAFVVGSDQVWRPLYFSGIENAFLSFASGWKVKRLAYAASFGTNQLEYDYQMLEICSKLLETFDGVSVREANAVQMCRDWFDYENPVHVLDPVMLLKAEHYKKMTESQQERPAKGKIMTYILDRSEQKNSVVKFMSRVSSKEVCDASVTPYDKNIPLADRIVPSLERWLSCFVDADLVVTDSFHGCILSILMHKPFVVLENPNRGMSRIRSLLETFDLEQRIVHGIDPDDDGEEFLSDPDWDRIDQVLNERREISKNFLTSNLK